jgi:hypothetical protein
MKVRTTMQPHVEVEVNEAELLDLRRQGLLIEDPETPEARKVTAKTKEG